MRMESSYIKMALRTRRPNSYGLVDAGGQQRGLTNCWSARVKDKCQVNSPQPRSSTQPLERMIQDTIVQRAVAALDAIARGRWRQPHSELQEDGTFLLLSVDADVPREVFDDELRKLVAAQLNAIVPPSPAQALGPWIVVFKTGGSVYESLLPSGL